MAFNTKFKPPLVASLLVIGTSLTLFGGTLLVVRSQLVGLVEGDHAAVGKTIEDLLRTELLSIESEANRIAAQSGFQNALEEVDEDSGNLAIAGLKLKNGQAAALYDFDNEFFLQSGFAPTPQVSKPVLELVSKASQGAQNSILTEIDRKLALASVVPIGDREQPSGTLLWVRWVDDDLLNKLQTYVLKDLTIVHSGLVSSSTLEKTTRFSIEGILRDTDSSTHSTFETGELSGATSPLDLYQGSGRVVLISSQPSLVASIPWHTLFQLFGVTTFIFVGVAISWGRKNQKAETRLIQEISDTFEELSKSQNLELKPKWNEAKALAPLTAHFNDMMTSLKATSDTSKNYRINLEKRIAKISDVLSIENGAFRFFLDRVTETKEICDEEIRRIQANERQDFQQTITALFRNAHTIKSNAKLFNLQYVHKEAKSFEDFLEQLRKEKCQGDEKTVLELYGSLKNLMKEVDSYKKLRLKLLGPRSLEDASKGDNAVQIQWLTSLAGRIFAHFKNPTTGLQVRDSLHEEFERSVATVGKEDVSTYIRLYDNMCKTYAARMGKKINPIALTGNVRYLPSDKLHDLNDMLVHCLKNCISHGIERPEKRKNNGKDPAGNLRIDFQSDGDLLKIGIFDDGRGIDPDRLARKIVQSRLASKEQVLTMSDGDLVDYIFTPGLSTADTVTEVSGRGVGMDVVRDSAQKLGGAAKIESTSSSGTHIEISIGWKRSRFIDDHSVFDLGMAVQTMHQEFESLFAKNRLKTTLGEGFRGRNLVCNDHSLIVECLRQVFVGLIASSPIDGGIAIDLVESASDLTINFKSPQFDQEMLQMGSWIHSISKLEEVSDFKTAIEPEINGVALKVPTHLPKKMEETKLNILVLAEEYNLVQSHISRYLLTRLATWPHEVFSFENMDQFKAASQGSPSGTSVIFIDNEFMDPKDFARHFSKRNTYNVVLKTSDASCLTPDDMFAINEDPLIVENEFDPSAISQALETSILKAIKLTRTMDELEKNEDPKKSNEPTAA